jgi:hypothetical protein
MQQYLLAAALLLMPQLAEAGDGNQLLKECNAFVKGDNISEEHGLKLWAGCPSSIEVALSDDIELSTFRKVCPPENIKNGQLARMIVSYLERYPEQLHYDEFRLVTLIIGKSFPCSLVDQFRRWYNSREKQ